MHDDLLDVTVALVEVADGRERVDSLRRRLADPDEDPRGERDVELARDLDGLEPTRGHFVGRTIVSLAGFEQTNDLCFAWRDETGAVRFEIGR